MSANTLGRYHIIREIARSNDIVYEAMDPALGRKIALKELQIPPNLTGMARHDRIQRFTREARAAAGLHHKNIVRIFEHGQTQEGRYFIAMEFLEGGSLRDVLRQRGSLPTQEALRIAADVADGLEYAHRHGVVHRDVKPDNVHLEPDGRVVITDFGIARLTFEPSLTADGQIFGTPSYMSPEQVRGGDLDKRSDIFSLGVMLYEMLSGRKPFIGDSVITITYNIMNVDPPPLAGPQGVDAIMRCALAKEMRYRYTSAAEMAEDIRSLAKGQPTRRAMAISPPGSGIRVGSAASLNAPTPVTRTPGPAAPAPVYRAPSPQPGPPRGGAPVAPRPLMNGAPIPRAAVPNGSGAAAVSAPAGFVAARPRQRAVSRGSSWGWLLGWTALAAVLGLMILALVWSFVTAYDHTQDAQNRTQITAIRTTADKAYHDGKFQQALEGYRQVANSTKGSEQAIARHNAALSANELAVDYMKNGNLDESERFARQGIEIDPLTIEPYITLGSALQRRGKIDDAVAQYDLAIQQANAAMKAGGDKAQAERNITNASENKAQALYGDGLELERQNKNSQAEVRFRGAIGAAPNSKAGLAALDELQRLGASTAPGLLPGGGDPYSLPTPGSGTDPGTGPASPLLQGGNQPLPGPTNVPYPPTGGGSPALEKPPGWQDVHPPNIN